MQTIGAPASQGGQKCQLDEWDKERDPSPEDPRMARIRTDPILPDHPVCRPLHSLPKDLLSETRFHKLLKVHLATLPSTVARILMFLKM